jgi:hypothetical protein
MFVALHLPSATEGERKAMGSDMEKWGSVVVEKAGREVKSRAKETTGRGRGRAHPCLVLSKAPDLSP